MGDSPDYNNFAAQAGMGGNLAGPMPIQEQYTPPSSAELGVTAQQAAAQIPQYSDPFNNGQYPSGSDTTAYQNGPLGLFAPGRPSTLEEFPQYGPTRGEGALHWLQENPQALGPGSAILDPLEGLGAAFSGAKSLVGAGRNIAEHTGEALAPNLVAHALAPDEAQLRARLEALKERLGTPGPMDNGGL